mgnify:CR=1 FL=1
MITITINGERQATDARTVEALVAELGLRDQPVAVERNREVVPKREHGQATLQDGDVLEVVTLVGGG